MTDSSKDLLNWDRDFVWHPFTQMRQWADAEQLVIVRAAGNYLFDADGRKYFDGVSSLWITVHGHCHPVINAAVQAQLETLDHSTLLGLANEPSIRLAKRLIEKAPPGLTKVFYSDSGSTAVEVALKIAFQYWQQRKPDAAVPKPKKKTRFVSLRQAYHGDTVGSVSVGGIDLFHELYWPLLFQTFKIPAPHCYRCELGLQRESCELACAAKAREVIAEHHGDLAALIVEPRMQGAAGMYRAPDGYLRELRAICDEYQVLLIADEVATGFGRTGKLFACEWEGVTPDLLCLAKGITGGYLPLAATLATDEIYRAFLAEVGDLKAFFHGHTYTGNPLACAAALANLDLLEKPNFWAAQAHKINHLQSQLETLGVLDCVGDIRQEGLMVGIELVRNRATKEPFAYAEQIGAKICYACRPKGLLIRPLGDVLVLMPPLSVTEEEITWMISTIREVLGETFG